MAVQAFAAILVVISMTGGVDQKPVLYEQFSSVEACLKKADQLNNPPEPPFNKRLDTYPNGLVAGGKFAFCVKPVYPV